MADDAHIAALVAEYLATPKHARALDIYLKTFQKRTLAEAIEQAGYRLDGKVHGHQRLVGKEKLRQAAKALQKNIEALKSLPNFEALHQFVTVCTKRIKRFGVLARYDISLRIGAKLGLLPEMVHLHAGTKDGCKTLGLKIKGKTIEMTKLPTPLQKLAPHHAENFLCIYKGRFAVPVKSSTRRRSRCQGC
jgi:hypothetical protein